jgi:hypothetical protein
MFCARIAEVFGALFVSGVEEGVVQRPDAGGRALVNGGRQFDDAEGRVERWNDAKGIADEVAEDGGLSLGFDIGIRSGVGDPKNGFQGGPVSRMGLAWGD